MSISLALVIGGLPSIVVSWLFVCFVRDGAVLWGLIFYHSLILLSSRVVRDCWWLFHLLGLLCC
jgi:hypothetical protein